MKRSVYNSLIEWKLNKRRKPLILNGARQVGKTYVLQEFAKQGYTIVNLGGLTSELRKDYNSTVKTELANKIVEYIGEFDLVINKKAYYTGTKLNPILNWLNTPI